MLGQWPDLIDAVLKSVEASSRSNNSYGDYIGTFKHKLFFRVKAFSPHIQQETSNREEYVFVQEWNEWFPLDNLELGSFFVDPQNKPAQSCSS